eukprot:8390607-Pyramimonas_sp.AAC.1
MPGNSVYALRRGPLGEGENVGEFPAHTPLTSGGREGEVNDGRVASGAPRPRPCQRRLPASLNGWDGAPMERSVRRKAEPLRGDRGTPGAHQSRAR